VFHKLCRTAWSSRVHIVTELLSAVDVAVVYSVRVSDVQGACVQLGGTSSEPRNAWYDTHGPL